MRPQCWLTVIMFWCFLREKALANSTRRHLICQINIGGDAGYRIEDTPLDLCTHVLYFAARIDPESYEITQTNPQRDLLNKGYQKLADLKKRRPDVKLLIGVYCISSMCDGMIATNNTRKTFIESAIRLLRRYNFDGLSFTLQMVNQRINRLYPTLMEETKQAFKDAGRAWWTVSDSTPGREVDSERGLELAQICRAADFVIIAGIHFTTHTDVPYPLKRRNFDPEGGESYNVVDWIKQWINIGCPRNKILLKVGFHAIEYTLANENDHGMHAAAESNWRTIKSYIKICSKLQEKGWTIDWDERSASPFAYRGKEWIGYDNEVSLEEKAHFVDSEGLGGLVVFSLGDDDFKGVCGKKYPLLRALFEAYKPTWSTDDDPFAFAIERSRRDVHPN